MKSLKELFRIGQGPSSSHTMGPRFAAEKYLLEHPDAICFRATLYESSGYECNWLITNRKQNI